MKKRTLDFKEIHDWEILTDDGFQDFDGIKVSEADEIFHLTFSNDVVIECTTDHKFYINGEITEAIDLKIGDSVDCASGKPLLLTRVVQVLESTKVYTPINVDNGHRYITDNEVIHKNCAFIPPNIMEELWSAVYPIISSAVGTKVILVSTPNGSGNLFHELYTAGCIKNKEGWTSFKFMWHDVPNRDDAWKRKQIASFNGDMMKWNQEFGCFTDKTFVHIRNSKTGEIKTVDIQELQTII